MNIAVCDDEQRIQEKIKSLIVRERPDFYIETFTTGEELLAAQRDAGKSFDIVFLDIQMDGINGVETARVLRSQNEESVLIFVTALKEYVFEAFDVAAFHYLLKPIQEQRFKEVFDRAVREVERQRKRTEERLIIKSGKRNISLYKSSILYVENKAKKLEIHTTKEVIEIYSAMNELEGELGTGFYRCHRGYLVNMAYIVEYEKNSITLNNGESVYLAKDKYSEFVKRYMRYLRNGARVNV